MYFNVSPNRGKPDMTPEPMPTLVYPTACIPPPLPPTPPATLAECAEWRAQIQVLREELVFAEDVTERKQILQAIGDLRGKMQRGRCQ